MKGQTACNSACLLWGRILMLLTVALVIVMPLTEYLWHFDDFLRGGQDFELGLFCMMTFLCLILVLFQHGRRSVECLLSRRRWLGTLFLGADPGVPGSLIGLIASLHAVPLPSAGLGLYNLPLQI